MKGNKRYEQELWWIFNPPCCLDFKFSLQHLTLSELDLSKGLYMRTFLVLKWGMEGASQTYFLWQDPQASPPHYGSVPEEIPPRAPKRTKATFPWAHPLLPPATAPRTPRKPPHKVTFSCGDTRNSPAGHVCVTASLSQRMTPLIAAWLQSFDMKNMLFQPQQASALPGFQQVLNCWLSRALWLLTEDQTELCHL